MSSNLPPQDATSEGQDQLKPGLPITEVTQLCNTLSNLNISTTDADRLCRSIRIQAYYLFGEVESRRIRREGSLAPLGFRPTPLSKLPQVFALPSNIRIPNHHRALSYNNFSFVFPYERRCGTYYVVTCGLLVGVFSLWINVAPLVSRVKGAAYVAVKSVDEGAEIILDAIEDGVVMYLEVKQEKV